jgi:hypothetical protein
MRGLTLSYVCKTVMGVSGMIHGMIVSKQPVIDQLLNFKPVDATFKLGGAAGNMGMF